MKKGSLEKIWNGVRLEEEEREDLEIRGVQEVTTGMRGKFINRMECRK